MKARTGQVAIYLIMVLVVILTLALMNVDTFLAVRSKNHVQHAGDAAVLAAARQQALVLNEIGRLNVEHLLAVFSNDVARCEEIVLAQRRLALLGPVEGLRLANQAAKKNGMPVREEFSSILEKHVLELRFLYEDVEQESYPGAMRDYVFAIENVLRDGLAVGPDNMEFYNSWGGHLLLNRNFYFAISGKNWCWFHFNADELLANYNSYQDWGPLPQRTNSWVNSEIFSLQVATRKCAALDIFSADELKDLVEQYSDEHIFPTDFEGTNLLSDATQEWFFYDPATWRTWYELDDLPMIGDVKDEYDVRGCASICRCVLDGFTWSAAAKPFGMDVNGFILPSFSHVRLVPLDSVGGEDLATADYDWVMHFRYHLIPYLLNGPHHDLSSACFYCRQLKTWERTAFRHEGLRWLKFHSDTCVRPVSGPGGSTGGTSHGH